MTNFIVGRRYKVNLPGSMAKARLLVPGEEVELIHVDRTTRKETLLWVNPGRFKHAIPMFEDELKDS